MSGTENREITHELFQECLRGAIREKIRTPKQATKPQT